MFVCAVTVEPSSMLSQTNPAYTEVGIVHLQSGVCPPVVFIVIP